MANDKEDQYREGIEGGEKPLRESTPEKETREEEIPEKAPAPEEREVQERRERMVEARVAQKEELKRPAETPQLTLEQEKEAKEQAGQMEGVAPEGKVERLLDLLAVKGLPFVNRVIANMDPRDAFVVDTFHDTLAKEERYKKFLEK